MDPLSLIITALALGAAAGLKPTAENAVKDAYSGLKALIQRKYAEVDLSILEKDPASKTRQEVLAEDLTKTNVVEDTEVLARAIEMIESVRIHDPNAARSVGVNLKDIQGEALKIKGVTVTGDSATGVKIESADIKGAIEISNVRASGSRENHLKTKLTSSKTGKSGKKKTGKTQDKSSNT